RGGFTQNFPQIEFGGFTVLGKTSVQGLDEGGFDLGSGGEFAGAGEDDGIVVGLFTADLFDDEVPDSGTLPGVGQVDEPDFIPAPLAEHFGWQLADIIGGGDDKGGTCLVLQPVQHCAEDSTARTSVGTA